MELLENRLCCSTILQPYTYYFPIIYAIPNPPCLQGGHLKTIPVPVFQHEILPPPKPLPPLYSILLTEPLDIIDEQQEDTYPIIDYIDYLSIIQQTCFAGFESECDPKISVKDD